MWRASKYIREAILRKEQKIRSLFFEVKPFLRSRTLGKFAYGHMAKKVQLYNVNSYCALLDNIIWNLIIIFENKEKI